jgi:predicted transport protein
MIDNNLVFGNCFTGGYATSKYFRDLTKIRDFHSELYSFKKSFIVFTGSKLFWFDDIKNMFRDLKSSNNNTNSNTDLNNLLNQLENKYRLYHSYVLYYSTHNHFLFYKFGNFLYFSCNINNIWYNGQRHIIIKQTNNTDKKYNKQYLYSVRQSFGLKYLGILGFTTSIKDTKQLIDVEYDYKISHIESFYDKINFIYNDLDYKAKNYKYEEIKNINYPLNQGLNNTSGYTVEPLASYFSIPVISEEIQYEFVYETFLQRNQLTYDTYNNKIIITYPFSFTVFDWSIKEILQQSNNEENFNKLLFKYLQEGKYIFKLLHIYPFYKKKTEYQPKLYIPEYYPDTLMGLMNQIAINSILASANSGEYTHKNENSSNKNVFNCISYNNTHLAVSDIAIGYDGSVLSSPLHIFFSLSNKPISIKISSSTDNNYVYSDLYLQFVYTQFKNTNTNKKFYYNEVKRRFVNQDSDIVDVDDLTDDFIVEYANNFNVEPHIYVDFPVFIKPRILSVKKHEENEEIFIPEKFKTNVGVVKEFQLTLFKDDKNKTDITHYGLTPINKVRLKLPNSSELEDIINESKYKKSDYLQIFEPLKYDIFSLDKPITQRKDKDYILIDELYDTIPISLKVQSFNFNIENNSKTNSSNREFYNYITVFVSLLDCSKGEAKERLIYTPIELGYNSQSANLSICEILLSNFKILSGNYFRNCERCNSYRSNLLFYIFRYYRNKNLVFRNLIYRLKFKIYSEIPQEIISTKPMKQLVSQDIINNLKNKKIKITFEDYKKIDEFTTNFPIMNVGIDKQNELRIITPDYKEISYIFSKLDLDKKDTKDLFEDLFKTNDENSELKQTIKNWISSNPVIWCSYDENEFDILK